MSIGGADIPIGLVLEVATAAGASPSTWQPLAEVTSFQPPQLIVEAVETTHMGSPGRQREFKPGLTDSGAATGTMNFIPGSQTDVFLQAWRVAAEVRQVRATFPNGWRKQFPGFLMEYSPNQTDVGAVMQASFAIRITGTITESDITP